jgi:uncharacterized low-complexity protein
VPQVFRRKDCRIVSPRWRPAQSPQRFFGTTEVEQSLEGIARAELRNGKVGEGVCGASEMTARGVKGMVGNGQIWVRENCKMKVEKGKRAIRGRWY